MATQVKATRVRVGFYSKAKEFRVLIADEWLKSVVILVLELSLSNVTRYNKTGA